MTWMSQNQLLTLLINFIFLILFYRLIKYTLDEGLRIFKRNIYYKNYDIILRVLDNAKELAYKKIYQEKLLVSSSSGMRIEKEEIFALHKTYANLVVKLAGNEILNDLINIHGNLETVLLNLGNGFVIKVNEDEVYMADIIKNKDDEPEIDVINKRM